MTPTNEALREFYRKVKQAHEATGSLDDFETCVLEALEELARSDADAKPPLLSVIQARVDEAARAIASLDVTQWASWVVYLLEALDTDLDTLHGLKPQEWQTEQTLLLMAVRDAIEGRLLARCW